MPEASCGQRETWATLANPARLSRSWVCAAQVAFGVTLDGPIGHVWYTLLDGNVFPKEPTSNRAVVCKMLLDQLLWAPFFSCVFFVFTNVLAVRTPLTCTRHVSSCQKSMPPC